jgi:hypothetical protein
MIVFENINNSKIGKIKYLEFISHISKFTLSVGYLLAHEIAYEIKFFLNGKFRNFHKKFLDRSNTIIEISWHSINSD